MSEPRTFRTVCPRNCYCTCGMLVTVADGRVVRIEGDPDLPGADGRICVKGLSYVERAHSPERLLHPLRRTGMGAFEPVTWADALDEIASRLAAVRERHGPKAVLYYEGSGSHGALGRLSQAFWRQFGGCTVTHGDLCWPAGLEATRITYGANLHNDPRLTAGSRFVILWGHNPAETNIHQMRLLLDAQERGARLALIDPRSTDTADAMDLHLQPRPGTDAALALGMARCIVEAGLHDEAFLREYAHGWDAYRRRIDPYALPRVSDITGIPASHIRALAEEYASTKPALLIAGFGLQRHARAGQTMRAVCLLPALTGNVGIAGGGWQYANLASHCLSEPPLPSALPAGRIRSVSVARLAAHLAEVEDPPIRALWIEKGNPASQHPRSDRVRERLRRLDLVVVVDQFMTETARQADVILPAKTLFEEEDLVTAYWHPYLQYRARILDPPGEVRTEAQIWKALGDRLAFDTSFFPTTPEERRRVLRSMLPDREGCTLEALETQAFDCSPPRGVAFGDLRFPTPSGKVEFEAREAFDLWGCDPLPDYLPLEEGHESDRARRFPLQLLTCKTRERIHSQFGNLESIGAIERPRRLDVAPRDAADRGLADGDVALVRNDRGSIRLPVRIDHGLRPGVVHIPEGMSKPGDPDVNVLIGEGGTDMNHGATFYECLVEVEKEAERA